MEYTFEKLNRDNFNNYFYYLLLATKLEAENKWISTLSNFKQELRR